MQLELRRDLSLSFFGIVFTFLPRSSWNANSPRKPFLKTADYFLEESKLNQEAKTKSYCKSRSLAPREFHSLHFW